MGKSFEDLLEAMPEIANAVNGFENADAQQRALAALLDAFFGHEREVRDSSDAGSSDGSGGGASPPLKSPEVDHEVWEQQLFDGLPDEHRVAKGKRDHQAVWAAIILRQLGQEATTTSIASIVSKRLGMSPEDRDNLSSRLSRLTPQYLRRDDRAEGRGFAYFPTRDSLKVFEDLKA